MHARIVIYIMLIHVSVFYGMETKKPKKITLPLFDATSVTYDLRDECETYSADLVDSEGYAMSGLAAKKYLQTGIIEYYEIRSTTFSPYFKKNDPTLFNALKQAYENKPTQPTEQNTPEATIDVKKAKEKKRDCCYCCCLKWCHRTLKR